jgi:putative salt-induced outer membrane protein YdiY
MRRQNTYFHTSLKLLSILILLPLAAQAGRIELSDGSRVMGSIVSLKDGILTVKTQWADALSIPQDQVVSLSSETVVNFRLKTGEILRGTAQAAEGAVIIASASAEASVPVASIEAVWAAGERDPAEVARLAAVEAQVRKWSYQVGFDMSGSSGNAENLGSSLNAQAKLEGPNDRLLLYGNYTYKETDGLRSADEQKGGIRYTNFFGEKYGWFVREELERDTFEGVDFRSTTALGLSYRFVKKERLSLEGSLGLSYRYDSFGDVGLADADFPGLDIGADFSWQFADWGKLVTNVTYLPSVEDLSDYLIEQETGIDVPLGTSDAWVMRFGLSNQYNSQPAGMRKELDTTWFARLLLNWD